MLSQCTLLLLLLSSAELGVSNHWYLFKNLRWHRYHLVWVMITKQWCNSIRNGFDWTTVVRILMLLFLVHFHNQFWGFCFSRLYLQVLVFVLDPKLLSFIFFFRNVHRLWASRSHFVKPVVRAAAYLVFFLKKFADKRKLYTQKQYSSF